MKAKIHTDASCWTRERGHAAPMRIGYSIQTEIGTVVARVGQAIGDGTVNRAEFLAVIHALRHALRLGFDSADILTDSQLLARQFEARYQPRDRFLIQHLRHIREIGKLIRTTISWIPRSENRDADDLSRQSLYESPLIQTQGLHDLAEWQGALIRRAFERDPELSIGEVSRAWGIEYGIAANIRAGRSYRSATLDSMPNWDAVKAENHPLPSPTEKEARAKALEELVAQAQELDMGY